MGNDLTSTLLQFLWKISWQVGILACVVFVVTRLAPKAPAAWRHALWLLVLIKLFVPPLAYLPSGLAFWQAPKHMPTLTAPETYAPAASAPSHFVFKPAPEPPTPVKAANPISTGVRLPSWPDMLGWAWLAGVAAAGTTLFARGLRQVRLIRRSSSAGEELTALLRECASRLPVWRLPRLKLSDRVSTPALVGLFRPVILLPEEIAGACSRAELTAMLTHELAHVRRWDMVGAWLDQLAKSLFFFHPAAWLAGYEIKKERELACDELVLSASAIGRREYAEGYLAALRLANCAAAPVSLAMAEPADVEKRRLNMILHNEIPRMSARWVAVMALILAIGLPTFGGVGAKPWTPAGNAPTIAAPAGSNAHMKGFQPAWPIAAMTVPPPGGAQSAALALQEPPFMGPQVIAFQPVWPIVAAAVTAQGGAGTGTTASDSQPPPQGSAGLRPLATDIVNALPGGQVKSQNQPLPGGSGPSAVQWEIVQCDELPSVNVDGRNGYRILLRLPHMESRSQQGFPGDEGVLTGYSYVDLVLFPSKVGPPANAISRIPWSAVEQKYYAKAVDMGEGRGFRWFGRTEIVLQDLLREKLGLAGGDDRIRTLLSGLTVKDAKDASYHTAGAAVFHLRNYREKAAPYVPYVENAIRRTQDRELHYCQLEALGVIPGERATRSLQSFYASSNRDLSNAAAQALVMWPRESAKRQYFDMLRRERHIGPAARICAQFKWKDALPLINKTLSNPTSWYDYRMVFEAKRALLGKPGIPRELDDAGVTLRQSHDPAAIEEAKATISNHPDKASAVIVAVSLAIEKGKGSIWATVNAEGREILKRLPGAYTRPAITALRAIQKRKNHDPAVDELLADLGR